MTTSLLLGSAVPFMQNVFPAVPLVQQVQHTPFLILSLIDLCMAIAYLALWRAAPDFRAFRTMGIFYVLVFLQQTFTYFGGIVPTLSMRALAAIVLIEFAGDAMRITRRKWTRLFWPVYLFVSVAVWFPPLFFTSDWPLLVSEIPLGILVVQGFCHGNARDKLISAAFGFYLILRPTLSTTLHKFLGINENFTILGWQWNYTVVYLTLLGALTLTVFVRELISDRSEKQRLAAELAASRAVQQVLIPDHTPEIAGFTIRSVYKPYGEVGGDFYQILPLPNGGALIAIGDVSGKGMPAAMMVSLLVGALHALVETTSSPGELLSGLNRLVQGRSHGGFTTCLILGIEPDGTVTFANAGHIPPYLQGKELLCENGLPLGLIVAGAYTESSFLLIAGEQLTLVTDGVVEARNEAGELFGFERTAANASLMAEAIAQQAQVFGQDDDITVLTVARMATE